MAKLTIEEPKFEVNINAVNRQSQIVVHTIERSIEEIIKRLNSEEDGVDNALEFHKTIKPHVEDMKRVIEKFKVMEELLLEDI